MTKTNITTETRLDLNNDKETTQPEQNQLLEQVNIENTPFTAVRLEDKWFLTMGKYRLTETLQSLDECIEQSKDASWWRIMQIVNIMIEEHDRTKKVANSAQI